MGVPNAQHAEAGRALWILRIGTAACFVGWAWQHLYWSAPYDALLWNPDYFGFVESFDIDWERYVAEVASDTRIRIGTLVTGWFLFAMSIVAFGAKKPRVWQSLALGTGSVILCILAFCNYLNAGNQTAAWIERAGQFSCPILLVLALHRGITAPWTKGLGIVALCMTFGGHGVYALGWLATPGHFLGMTMQLLHLNQHAADAFLKFVGILDLLLCVGVFIPKLRRPSLMYATVWGTLTALARPISGMAFAAPYWGADAYLHEAILRAPHAMIPLFLLIVFRHQSSTITAANHAEAEPVSGQISPNTPTEQQS